MQIQEIDALRRDMAAVSAAGAQQATRALSAVTQAVSEPSQIAGAARSIAPVVVEQAGSAAATGSAMFYERVNPNRNAARAVLAKPNFDELHEQLSWAVAPLFNPANSATVAISSLLERYSVVVLNAISLVGRDTVVQSAANDNTWCRRYARPNACTYCQYMTTLEIDVKTSYNRWHDYCRCVNVPWFEDNPFPITEQMRDWERAAAQAERNLQAKREAARAASTGMRDREFFAANAELAISPKNIVREMGLLV